MYHVYYKNLLVEVLRNCSMFRNIQIIKVNKDK